MKNVQTVRVRNEVNAHKVNIDKKTKKEFLKFLDKNKKDLRTGFGSFHTDNHSMW